MITDKLIALKKRKVATSAKYLLYLKTIYAPLKIFKTFCNNYTHIIVCDKNMLSLYINFAETSLKTVIA